MKIAVGSKNPVKIEAVRLAFAKVWPDKKWEVVGVEVKSGVTDQPMSDKEGIMGAQNRAKRALEKLRADYGVGLEGGLQKIGRRWFCCGWLAVVNKKGEVGLGSSARMVVPSAMIRLIKTGKELGEVEDKLFGKSNAKQAEGYFGLMTKNVLTRMQGYRDGVIVALARFIQPQLF